MIKAEYVAELEADLAKYKEFAAGFVRRIEGMDARFAAIADCQHIAVNKWLVQVARHGKWYLVYFADPPGGPATYKAASVLDALREAIDLSEKDRQWNATVKEWGNP